MRNNVLNAIYFYANWISTTYHAVSKVNSSIPMLRLIAKATDSKTGQIRFKIQIAGKNIFPVVPLSHLNKPAIVSNFSKNDQAIIFSYFHSNKSPGRKRITARTYDRATKQFIFTIESFDAESKLTKCITVNNLALSISDTSCFDKEDARLIELERQKVLH